MANRDTVIGPSEMGLALIKALGLEGVKGIVKLQIAVEVNVVPTLTIVRAITHEQAELACVLLREWNCELVPSGVPVDREVRADGTTVEVPAPPSPSVHPREG